MPRSKRVNIQKKDSLYTRVFTFLNKHPRNKEKSLFREFKDESKSRLHDYYYRWKRENLPLMWLYEHMMKKWKPVKPLSVRDKIWLRKIEKKIGKDD